MESQRRRTWLGRAARRRSLWVMTAVLACVGVFVAAQAWALSFEEQFQGLTVTPFLSERFEYESNVFQTPNRIRGDAIFKTIPGFLADLTRGPFSVSAGYRAEIINYATL